jgi:hypothetical protein
MTVIDPVDNQAGNQSHFNTFRNQWGIPLGRPGASRDYAQCIFGLISVSWVSFG